MIVGHWKYARSPESTQDLALACQSLVLKVMLYQQQVENTTRHGCEAREAEGGWVVMGRMTERR